MDGELLSVVTPLILWDDKIKTVHRDGHSVVLAEGKVMTNGETRWTTLTKAQVKQF